MIIENQRVKVRWNNANRKHYESHGYAFTKNGEEFEIDIKHITKGSKAIIKLMCDWCQDEVNRKCEVAMRNEHHFCSNKCQHEYRSYYSELNKPVKVCEQCNEEYKVENYNLKTSRFCSLICMSKWQSEAFKGNGNSKYVERINVNCDWCDEELLRTPSYLKNRTHNFCNIDCKRNFHREIYMKSEESIERNRKIMLNNLSEGKIKFTETKPHLIVNRLLDDLNIPYENEVIFGKYSIDVYLVDIDLLLEINGGFWHCDVRIYNEINYEYQLNRIIEDKKKNTFIKNKYNKNILYLWEMDIVTNADLCKKLIRRFIENSGNITENHSMNYKIDAKGDLIELDIKYKPYMYWDKKEIALITELTVREKRTTYQSSKHTTFNCDQCGKEKTQLTKQYEISKNHFCSVNCYNEFQKGKSRNQVV